METSKEPRVTSSRNLLVGRPDMLPTMLVTLSGEMPSALVRNPVCIEVVGGRPLTDTMSFGLRTWSALIVLSP